MSSFRTFGGPILDFLTGYTESGISRLHMPGHKGRAPEGYPEFLREAVPFDLTEIKGADELYEPEGIIEASEERTAALYHAGASCYSAGGSTLSILTMVTAAVRRFGREIIAVRNAHLAFVNACVHTDAEVHWLVPAYDRESGLCLPASREEIAKMMDAFPGAKIVYLTSPDYYGVQADVRQVAEEVHSRGGILLVDNAHGAHLIAFPGVHPMEAGADLCCDSPHKTLPVLTGGSLLQVREGMETVFPKAFLKRIMTLYGSTSPSYLIMASLEAGTVWMEQEGKQAFLRLAERIKELSGYLTEKGVPILSRVSDCTKLTIDAYRCGYTSDELAEFLRENRIEPEFCGGGKIVLMTSPQNTEEDFSRILRVADILYLKKPMEYPAFALRPVRAVPLREAAFSPSEEISVSDAVGRIAAENRIACPPGIPVVTAGEKIGADEKKMLLESGILRINVIE